MEIIFFDISIYVECVYISIETKLFQGVETFVSCKDFFSFFIDKTQDTILHTIGKATTKFCSTILFLCKQALTKSIFVA